MSEVTWPESGHFGAGWACDSIVEPIPTAALRDRRYRRRRSWSLLTGGLIAAVLHALLLLAWRSQIPPRVDAIGRDSGGGGITLSLVSGIAGIDVGATTAMDAADRQSSSAPMPSVIPDSSAAPAIVGAAQTEVSPEHDQDGHTSGGAAGAATAGAQSVMGTGIDPGDFASFAPLGFDQVSEPGFLDQVRRCLPGGLRLDLTLTVVLNDAGEVVGVYPSPSMTTSTTQNEPEAVAATAAGVTRCGPYHDLKGGLSHPLTLIVPAGSLVAGGAPEARG